MTSLWKQSINYVISCQNTIVLVALYCLLVPSSFAINTKEVTILTDNSYPPYSYVENGQAKGIYVDIIKEAAKSLAPHYKINIVAYPWKRALHEMSKGTAFAILPPYRHIEKRPYIWPYSVPIMKEKVIPFCNEDVNLLHQISTKKTPETSPLIIGINAGYLILNDILAKAVKENKIVIAENRSTRANIMKLYTKRIDCYLNDKHSTYNVLYNMQKLTSVNFDNIAEAFVVMEQTGHIGYSSDPKNKFLFKDDFITRMDDALLILKVSESYQKIIDTYIVKNVTKTIKNQKHIN